jgi:hypothetical protein
VLGFVALAVTGCATGTMSVSHGNGNGNGLASPMTTTTDDLPKCEGWYDTAANVCDSVGD